MSCYNNFSTVKVMLGGGMLARLRELAELLQQLLYSEGDVGWRDVGEVAWVGWAVPSKRKIGFSLPTWKEDDILPLPFIFVFILTFVIYFCYYFNLRHLFLFLIFTFVIYFCFYFNLCHLFVPQLKQLMSFRNGRRLYTVYCTLYIHFLASYILPWGYRK